MNKEGCEKFLLQKKYSKAVQKNIVQKLSMLYFMEKSLYDGQQFYYDHNRFMSRKEIDAYMKKIEGYFK